MSIDRLHATIEQLTDRLTDVEQTAHENTELRERVEELERENDRLREQLAEQERQIEATDAKTDAIAKKSQLNKDRITEIQSRELEKGAHLKREHVDTRSIDVHTDRLEKLTKEDGNQYFRLPNGEDPLDRGGQIRLSHSDLLPVQQLARLDDDMLRSATSSRPARLAVKLWRARADDTVGDNPWKSGSQTIREFVKASDLKHWIRRQDPGVSDSYAKKLVSRTIDALLDLTQNRIALRRKKERKNGLSYTERRVILPTDAAIPGEFGRDTPETAGVHG
ncbi:hypothetical protein [Natronocalculus amylovorans]|uniref:Uncharacterized protein n=1 Tax=Natronocalculus amylovorans TaxID=2917812 RepID=A0AAE3FYC8_9EURY|nr:hypothetical protein [Natronocalculus amylovorans]MCL9817461.1 hypothetical protein [Natronocalculus amylovorans]